MTAIRNPNQISVTRARVVPPLTVVGTTRIVAELSDDHCRHRAREGPPSSAAVPLPPVRRLVSGPDQRRLRRTADERRAGILERDLLARRGHLLPRVHVARDPEQHRPGPRR